MNKYIVYLGNTGCEGILDVTFYEEAYLEWQLLSNPDEPHPEMGKLLRSIGAMELRSRYNSHRKIEAYVWSTEYTPEELWDMLEKNGDYNHLVKTTAKPYLNTLLSLT